MARTGGGSASATHRKMAASGAGSRDGREEGGEQEGEEGEDIICKVNG